MKAKRASKVAGVSLGPMSEKDWQDREKTWVALEQNASDALKLIAPQLAEVDHARWARRLFLLSVEQFAEYRGKQRQAREQAAKAASGTRIELTWAQVGDAWDGYFKEYGTVRDADRLTGRRHACSASKIRDLRLAAGVKPR